MSITATPLTRTVSRPRSVLARTSLPIVLIVLIAVFSAIRPGQFPSSTNVAAIVTQQGIAMLVALAVTVTLAAGEFDMSVGANVGITAVVGAWAFGHGWPTPLVIVAALAVAVLVGLLNVLLVVVFGLTSFIATLGVGFLLAGLALMVTGGTPLYEGITSGFKSVTSTSILGLPSLAWIILAVVLVLWYVLEQTPAGRFIRVTGTGRDAAKLMGISTERYVAAAFLIAAVIAGIGGILLVSNNGAVPPTAGASYTLPAYAAAFLGATALRPVRYNILGTVVGVLVLSVGVSGLTMIGAPFWVPQVFNGIALLVALLVARSFDKKGQ
ncbi:ABC transporter permease [Rhodococcoides yunnanense]|uniref:ABC transporter permease n=1 Tax=Rhodococcoides yunnanense TaxID=278209 RepID=UPI0009349DBE|nr:ABC transporter permease [Rhodococcus yunnanensis]